MEPSNPAQQRLACIGDASRFRLVVALAAGERCVTDLAAAVGLSQSCTTRHLQTLHSAGLVHRVRHGKRVMIGLRRDEPELRPLFDYVLALAGRGEGPPAAGRGTRPARSTRVASAAPPGPAPRGPRHAPAVPKSPEAATTIEAAPDTDRSVARALRSQPLEDFLL